MEKIRYNDVELEEFRTLIEAKIESAKNDIRILKGSSTSENGTNDTYASANSYEDGAGSLARENTVMLVSRQEKFIRDLELALIRIENKTYGICKVTKKLIQKKRLELVPHATMSIEAKNNRNNN